MIKVVICDDNPLRSEGLRKIFSQTEDIKIAAETRTGEELWEALADGPCDAVILGVTLQSMNGFSTLADDLRARRPSLPVLVLSMNGQDKYAIRVLRLGAAGYVPLVCPLPELIDTLRTVASGGAHAEGPQTAASAEETPGGRKPAAERLTALELQVMLGLACELGIEEIARNLHVKPSALGRHLARVLSKLGMRTNPKLVRLAIQNQLLK